MHMKSDALKKKRRMYPRCKKNKEVMEGEEEGERGEGEINRNKQNIK